MHVSSLVFFVSQLSSFWFVLFQCLLPFNTACYHQYEFTANIYLRIFFFAEHQIIEHSIFWALDLSFCKQFFVFSKTNSFGLKYVLFWHWDVIVSRKKSIVNSLLNISTCIMERLGWTTYIQAHARTHTKFRCWKCVNLVFNLSVSVYACVCLMNEHAWMVNTQHAHA